MISTNNKSWCNLYYENEEKTKILKKYNEISEKEGKELLVLIENFLWRYLYNREFKDFQINQPISYKNNLTLYYNYVIYFFYDTVIKVDEIEKKIIFKMTKFIIYTDLIDLHNIIFDSYIDKKVPFNEIINQLIQFMLLILSSERENKFINEHYLHLERTDKFIGKSSGAKLLEKFKENYKYIDIKLVNNKLILQENENASDEKIEIKYENYSTKLMKKASI